MHPADRIRGNRGNRFNSARIILCVTGSIAATETVKLARQLIRYGAEVVPVMTREAAEILNPAALHFASGRYPVLELTGDVEHISLLSTERCAVIVAPATANVISKIANGIADDAVTTLCLNAVGMRIPVIVAPAMGASMLTNQFLEENMRRLRRHGIELLPSIMEEEEAKLLDANFITESALRSLSKGLLARRNVLVIGGASEEAIDDVRFISSRSSGATAVEIAIAAYEQRAVVTMWCGRMEVSVPPFIKNVRFRSVREAIELASGKKFDIVIVPASLSDFIPKKRKGKIASDSDLSLELESAPKLLDALRDKCRVLVGFKAEVAGEKELLERARKRFEASRLDMIVANRLQDVSSSTTKAFIITKQGEEPYEGEKRGLAERIIELVAGLK